MKSLSQTLSEERDRCRRLMREYDRIGSAGAFASALVGQAVAKSEFATRTGQFSTMRQSLMELQRFDDLPPSLNAGPGPAWTPAFPPRFDPMAGSRVRA